MPLHISTLYYIVLQCMPFILYDIIHNISFSRLSYPGILDSFTCHYNMLYHNINQISRRRLNQEPRGGFLFGGCAGLFLFGVRAARAAGSGQTWLRARRTKFVDRHGFGMVGSSANNQTPSMLPAEKQITSQQTIQRFGQLNSQQLSKQFCEWGLREMQHSSNRDFSR